MAISNALNLNLNKRLIWKEVKDYLFMTIGMAIFAFSFTLFLLPYEIVSSGVTGIASIIFYATGIPIQYPYFIINVVLFVLALKFLGRQFVIRTVYAIFMLSALLTLAQAILMKDGHFIKILGEHQEFMSIILACCFNGFGLAMVFLHNGSTGGTDIIAAT